MHLKWLAIMPELFLAGGGLLIFTLGAIRQQYPSLVLPGLALIAALGSAASAGFTPSAETDFSGLLAFGGYARFYMVLIAMVAAFSVLFTFRYAGDRGGGRDEFYAILLFAALGMVMVASALHWLFFFLGLELLSISLYVLIAGLEIEQSEEAALKYFVMGAVSSGFLTFGIALVYAGSGTLDIAESLAVPAAAAGGPVILTGLGLILAGVGFKISLVPFHLWTPDVYQGAPAPVAGFLAAGSKIALVAALLRFAQAGAGGGGELLVPVLWAAAALTMITGNITALAQTDLKRLLGYSSMAHMGYLLMAVLAVRQGGAEAVMFYSAVYAAMELGTFGSIAALSEKKSADRDALADYHGLGRLRPGWAAVLALCLFSLAGLPPTGGFFGKLVLFEATIRAGFTGLALIGMATAIISIFFYLRVVVFLYMEPPPEEADRAAGGRVAGFAGAVLFLLILWLGIIPSWVLELAGRLAPHTIGG